MGASARDSYSKAGVDVARVRRIQRSLAGLFEGTFAFRKGKAGMPLLPIGHYGGVIDLGGGRALTLHTDGVGTKVLLAQRMGVFDTVGIDCVAMTVNDLVCLGSEPLAILDYIALQQEDSELVEELSRGLVEGARRASVAIVGGETAILGDVIRGEGGRGFDLVSMGVGIADAGGIIDGSSIREGDAVLGVASSGLHSNGFTLVRRIVAGRPLDEEVKPLGTTLGDALLTPTAIYARPAVEAFRKAQVHGVAHITGGAFTKLTRLTGRRKLGFELELPPPPPVFAFLQKAGRLRDAEMYRTFNMGVGLCLVLPRGELARAARAFRAAGHATFPMGTISGKPGVRANGMRLA